MPAALALATPCRAPAAAGFAPGLFTGLAAGPTVVVGFATGVTGRAADVGAVVTGAVVADGVGSSAIGATGDAGFAMGRVPYVVIMAAAGDVSLVLKRVPYASLN